MTNRWWQYSNGWSLKHWWGTKRELLSRGLRNSSLWSPIGFCYILSLIDSPNWQSTGVQLIVTTSHNSLSFMVFFFFLLAQTHAPDMNGNHKIPNKLWYSVWFLNKSPQRLIAKQGLVHELLTYSWFIESVMQSFHFQGKDLVWGSAVISLQN